MSLKHALLGIIEARPMTGYELSQFFDASTRWLWSATHGQIYPLLKRMLADGLVTAHEDTRGQHLQKTVYEVTDAGRRELAEWVETGVVDPNPRDPFLVQAIFLDVLTPAAASGVLRRYAAAQLELAQQADAHSAQLAGADTPLVRERLGHRDPADHARILHIKASVFAGQASVARARAAWAAALAEELSGQ